MVASLSVRALVGFLSLFTVLTLVFMTSGSAQAQGPPDGPRVYAGVYLHDVNSFDQKNGVFGVDAELWLKWAGDFDPDLVRIANGANIMRESLGRESDGAWHSARWRIRGTLRGEFPVQRFPFDEQTLAVVLELPAQAGLLIPDLAASGMAGGFSITDWLYEPEFRPALSQEVFRSDLGSIAIEGQAAVIHRVGFEVVIRRPIRPVVLKLFLPLAIVALVVMASLFVHPDSTQPRVTMSVTGLVACFAFQFSVSDVLPEVAYLTLADALFIVVYVISITCVITAVTAHFLHRRGNLKAALTLDRTMRPLLPTVAILVVWNAIPEPYPPHVPEADPAPVVARHDSIKNTLRIGTTQRLRLVSSAAGVAAYWPLIYTDPDQGLQSLLVEQAPRVDSEALRLLAGGEVEVTWKIREDAKWSDGRPVTVEDLLLPMKASPDRHILEHSTPDERTLVLRWSERLARALEPPEVWPAKELAPIFTEGGFEAARRHLAEEPLPSLGPFRIVSRDDDRIVAEANPHFMGPAPNITRVEVIRFANAGELVEAFEKGDVDVTAPNTLSARHLETIRTTRPDVVHQSPSANFIILHPNLDHPLLSQVDVRRAILQAIDRESLAMAAFGEAGEAAHVPLSGPTPEGVVATPFDPEAARETIARHGATGATLTLTHPANTSEVILESLVEALADIGLVVELEEVQSSWGMWRDGGHKDLLLHTIRAARDVDPRQWWNLPIIDGRYPAEARNVAYTDAIHDLVEREMRALYPERRDQLRDALLAAWSERLPGIPLVFADERLLAAPSLIGWQRSPEAAFGVGLERWYVE